MPVAETIEHKLKAGLTPVRLTVTDQSHLHAGHAGARPGGETHFRVEIVSASFRGMTRVARQREVIVCWRPSFPVRCTRCRSRPGPRKRPATAEALRVGEDSASPGEP